MWIPAMTNSDASESISSVTRSSQSNSWVTAGLWLTWAKIQKNKNSKGLYTKKARNQKSKNENKDITYFAFAKKPLYIFNFLWSCGILELIKHNTAINLIVCLYFRTFQGRGLEKHLKKISSSWGSWRSPSWKEWNILDVSHPIEAETPLLYHMHNITYEYCFSLHDLMCECLIN